VSSRFLLSSWYEDNMYDKRILLEEDQPEKAGLSLLSM